MESPHWMIFRKIAYGASSGSCLITVTSSTLVRQTKPITQSPRTCCYGNSSASSTSLTSSFLSSCLKNSISTKIEWTGDTSTGAATSTLFILLMIYIISHNSLQCFLFHLSSILTWIAMIIYQFIQSLSKLFFAVRYTLSFGRQTSFHL